MKGEYQFLVQDWRESLKQSGKRDLIYCDPPYVGRHSDYYNRFDRQESNDLAQALMTSKANFVLSNWLENKYRRNDYIDNYFQKYPQVVIEHFYHVGASEKLRNSMKEVLVLKKK